MPDNFDLLVNNSEQLDGYLTAYMQDEDGHRSNVLDRDVVNSIRVRWELNGSLLPMFSGSWQLQAVFERIGSGTNYEIPTPPATVPWSPGGIYNQTITIPAGTINAGAYKVVVLLSHLDAAANPTQMAGFVEFPVVRFIDT